jgi:hypothetical protein
MPLSQVVGLSDVPIADPSALMRLIAGIERTTAATGANDTSSRSHAILQVGGNAHLPRHSAGKLFLPGI